ncbi:MAG: hypothetical protein PWP24_481 [Clostridiales bacterium]|nr:hypothetical protein [Clostridiales bacterium]
MEHGVKGLSKRIYQEKSARDKAVNWFLILGMSILYAGYLGILGTRVYEHTIMWYIALPIGICCLLATALNWFTYIKKQIARNLAGAVLLVL